MEPVWVYRKSEQFLWTVGFYDPKGHWHTDSDHNSQTGAAHKVHFLNGGGFQRKIDEKFSTSGEICKRSNGEVIPKDEPLFLLRARDRLALPLLLEYKRISQEDGCNDFHFTNLDKDIEAFKQFREQHPERMKQPSITRGK